MSPEKTKGKFGQPESVKIDNRVKKLLIEGVRKAGSQKKLAEIMGYSIPSNMIFQLMHAPKYKKTIPVSRLKRLQEFLA